MLLKEKNSYTRAEHRKLIKEETQNFNCFSKIKFCTQITKERAYHFYIRRKIEGMFVKKKKGKKNFFLLKQFFPGEKKNFMEKPKENLNYNQVFKFFFT